METIAQGVWMLKMEAGLAVSALCAVYLVFRTVKIWRSGDGESLMMLLGVSLTIVTVLYIILRDHIHFFGNDHALLFMLLYGWCALGTVFLAYRNTRAFKLAIGLVSQAGIIYGLYCWV